MRRARHRISWRRIRSAEARSPSGCSRLSHILDCARSVWYLDMMIKSVRIDNRKLMTHFGWAVEGVVR